MKMTLEKRNKILNIIKCVFLILLGCFILAVADALFIIPCNIVNGGIDSLSIIINHFVADKYGDITDIVIAVLQVVLWLIGLLFLGKKFSFYTLLGTFAFPAFYAILLRTNFIDLVQITAFYQKHTVGGELEFSVLLVSGLFGGLLLGSGLALTYLGDGSTGGMDVIAFLLAKYTKLPQDIGNLSLDTSMILLGFICLQRWELFFSGVLTAIVSAIIVRLIYVRSDNPVILDIISSTPKPIMAFVHDKLGHATTITKVFGGYSGEERTNIRAVVYGSEAKDVRAFVASVDKDAFITSTLTNNISGEGFEPLIVSPRSLRRILHRYGIKTKEDQSSKNEENKKSPQNKDEIK